jgi:hypothetical protein
MILSTFLAVALLVLIVANFALTLASYLRSKRHHEHLIPETPRTPRG